jgi:hypothetical protein
MFFFLCFGRHVWTNDYMVKYWDRVTFSGHARYDSTRFPDKNWYLY